MHAQLYGGAHVLLLKDNKVFLLRRAETGYKDGYYTTPAGGIEKDERPQEAAVRESLEETSVVIQEDYLEFVHVLHVVKKEKRNDRIHFFFVARKWHGTAQNAEPHKCDDASWFSLDKLPNKVVPYIRHALTNIRMQKYFSECSED